MKFKRGKNIKDSLNIGIWKDVNNVNIIFCNGIPIADGLYNSLRHHEIEKDGATMSFKELIKSHIESVRKTFGKNGGINS